MGKTVSLILTTYNSAENLARTIIRMYYGGTSTSDTGSYLKSLREGHWALKDNGVNGAFLIDFLRTCRVLLQFIMKPKNS